MPKSLNHLKVVNISPTPTLVIDASTSRVLQHENLKIGFFLNLKLNFDLWQRAEIVQVGLNMMTSGMHRRPFEGRHLVF